MLMPHSHQVFFTSNVLKSDGDSGRHLPSHSEGPESQLFVWSDSWKWKSVKHEERDKSHHQSQVSTKHCISCYDYLCLWWPGNWVSPKMEAEFFQKGYDITTTHWNVLHYKKCLLKCIKTIHLTASVIIKKCLYYIICCNV